MPLPSSRPSCAKPPLASSTICGAPSEPLSLGSRQPRPQTSSQQQAISQNESSPLWQARRMNWSIRHLFENAVITGQHPEVVEWPADVADVMKKRFTEGAADGFNILSAKSPHDIPSLCRSGRPRIEAPQSVPHGLQGGDAAREPRSAVRTVSPGPQRGLIQPRAVRVQAGEMVPPASWQLRASPRCRAPRPWAGS